ncbi:MAG: hypothetical protein GY851_10465 [bacterium]|nr:hypothetical protein [bacterium]
MFETGETLPFRATRMDARIGRERNNERMPRLRVGPPGGWMRFGFDFSKMPAYVLVWTEGEASVSGFDELLTELVNSPRWASGMGQVVDHRRLTASSLSGDDMQAIRNVVRRHADKLGQGKTAFVVSDALSFGMARMYELVGGDEIHQRVGVFYTVEEATQWLSDSETREPRD